MRIARCRFIPRADGFIVREGQPAGATALVTLPCPIDTAADVLPRCGQIVATMWRTALDMNAKYTETADGRLAVALAEAGQAHIGDGDAIDVRDRIASPMRT